LANSPRKWGELNRAEKPIQPNFIVLWSVIRKSGNWFSLATNAESGYAEIVLK